MPNVDFAQIRRQVQSGDYEISLHAFERMRKRGITIDDLEEVIFHGEMIERDPQAQPFPKCIFWRFTVMKGESIHVVCSLTPQSKIVTVYFPDEDKWGEIAYDLGDFMQSEETVCPLCGSTLVEKVIDYSDWNDGHLLVVRSVPVRECEANGHRFFHAKVARSLEKVFQADRAGELQPTEIMQVPVVEMEPIAL